MVRQIHLLKACNANNRSKSKLTAYERITMEVYYIYYKNLDMKTYEDFKNAINSNIPNATFYPCDSDAPENFSNKYLEFGPIIKILNSQREKPTDILIINDTVFKSHSRIFVVQMIKDIKILQKKPKDIKRNAYGEITKITGSNIFLSSYFIWLPAFTGLKNHITFSINNDKKIKEISTILNKTDRKEIFDWVRWRCSMRGWYGADRSKLKTRRNYFRKLCAITMERELSSALSKERKLTGFSQKRFLKLVDRLKINKAKIKKRFGYQK